MDFFTNAETRSIFIKSVRNLLTATYPDWKFIQPMEKYLFHKDDTDMDLSELYQVCQQVVEKTASAATSSLFALNLTTEAEAETLMEALRKLGFDYNAQGEGYIHYFSTSTSTVPKLVVENTLDEEGHCILRYHSGDGGLLTFSVWMDVAYVEKLNMQVASAAVVITGTYESMVVQVSADTTAQKNYSRIRDSLLRIKTIQECDPDDLEAIDQTLLNMSAHGTYQELLASEKETLYSRMQTVLAGNKFVHSFALIEAVDGMLKLPVFYDNNVKDEDPFSVCDNYKYVFYIHDSHSDQFYRVDYKAISEQIFVQTKPQIPLEITVVE